MPFNPSKPFTRNVSPVFYQLDRDARSRLSGDRLARPWHYTDHGTRVYDNEEDLDCYLAAYSIMHGIKLAWALEKFPFQQLEPGYEIIDWGCGQGLASIALLNRIHTLHAAPPHRIILIDPCLPALRRAAKTVLALAPNTECRTYNAFLPGEQAPVLERLKTSAPLILHLFSNILDVPDIDLTLLAHNIQQIPARHIALCVGPLNRSSVQIDHFLAQFSQQTFSIIDTGQSSQLAYLPGRTLPVTAKKLLFSFQSDWKADTSADTRLVHTQQFFAAAEPDCVQDAVRQHQLNALPETETAFDVLSWHEMGAADPSASPLAAVFSNILSRGLPTHISPFLEEMLAKAYRLTSRQSLLGSIRYPAEKTPEQNELKHLRDIALSVTRLEKFFCELLLRKKLPLDADVWNILIIEKDCPCGALAIQEFESTLSTLLSMSEEYSAQTLPNVRAVIVSQNKKSHLHLGCEVRSRTGSAAAEKWDLIVLIASSAAAAQLPDLPGQEDRTYAIGPAETLFSRRTFHTARRIRYAPFTRRGKNGQYVIAEKQAKRLRYFLRFIMRKEEFREGQLPILTRALGLKDVIGLLPTGGGKSLTYQLAALLQPGVCIVVDPILSLMKDQISGLAKNGIDCACSVSSLNDRKQKDAILNDVEMNRQLFVFLSPERFLDQNFRTHVRAMNYADVFFSFGVIDEVHCVSEWGHDFRTSYLHLGQNMRRVLLPCRDTEPDAVISFFGLTATASFDVLADIERELLGYGKDASVSDTETIVRCENTNRLELQYRIIPMDTDGLHSIKDGKERKAEMVQTVLPLLAESLRELQTPEAVARIRRRFIERENITDPERIRRIETQDITTPVEDGWYAGSGTGTAAIIFCPHAKGMLGVNDSPYGKGIASRLKSAYPRMLLSSYVGGGKSGTPLKDAQNDFTEDRTNVMVATKAFGMGIDKANVRFCVNICHSGSLEAYLQEAGRAGRDQKMALAAILYCPPFHGNDGVDNDVHQYFWGNAFRGAMFEKVVLYHLLAFHSVQILPRNGKNSRPEKTQARGIESLFSNVPAGETGCAVISYDSWKDDYRLLNASLQKFNCLPVSEKNPGTDQSDEDFSQAIAKALHRMCLVGLVEDITRNYTEKSFCLVIRHLDDAAAYAALRTFFSRYYTQDRAKLEAQKAQSCRGQTAYQKCLGYLTDFIYEKIAAKRQRSIADMEIFCQTAITPWKDWLEINEDLKDFVFFYFNSKYARSGYTTDSGKAYSLLDDTEGGKISDFRLVLKYMAVINDDMAETSTPTDNIRHLLGAVRLLRRSSTESNPTLDFLSVFCLLYLNEDRDENMQNRIRDDFSTGYTALRAACPGGETFYSRISGFLERLRTQQAADAAQLERLNEWILEEEIMIHASWLSSFSSFHTNNSHRIPHGQAETF